MFLVKNGDNFDEETGKKRCQIKYLSVDGLATKEEKFKFLREMTSKVHHTKGLRTFNELNKRFTKIVTNKKTHQWLGQVENDWQELVPLITRKWHGKRLKLIALIHETKKTKLKKQQVWIWNFANLNML